MDISSAGCKEICSGVYASKIAGMDPHNLISLLVIGKYRAPTAEDLVSFLVERIKIIRQPFFEFPKLPSLQGLLVKKILDSPTLAEQLTQNNNGYQDAALTLAKRIYLPQTEGMNGVYFTLAYVHPLAYQSFEICSSPSAYYALIDSEDIKDDFPDPEIIATAEVPLRDNYVRVPQHQRIGGFGSKKEQNGFREFLQEYCNGPITNIEDFSEATPRILYERAAIVFSKLRKYLRNEKRTLENTVARLEGESCSSSFPLWRLSEVPRS